MIATRKCVVKYSQMFRGKQTVENMQIYSILGLYLYDFFLLLF